MAADTDRIMAKVAALGNCRKTEKPPLWSADTLLNLLLVGKYQLDNLIDKPFAINHPHRSSANKLISHSSFPR